MKTDLMRLTGVGALSAALLLTSVSSCSSETNRAKNGSDSATSATEFHADNDIAMIVCSVADAIGVGESLDTLSYNFDGVLTDGQGRPVYSNLHGMPGKWDIDAVSDTSLTIRNVELGDLLSDDLESYIVTSFGENMPEPIDSLTRISADGHTTRVYRFEGGKLRFEVHNVNTPADETAAMMIISLSK